MSSTKVLPSPSRSGSLRPAGGRLSAEQSDRTPTERLTERTQNLRRTALQRAEAWLRTRTTPRLHMTLIVSATGAAAFLFSFLMLWAGLGAMGIRYSLAAGLAYLVFPLLLRIWLSYTTSNELKATKAGLATYLFLSGKCKDEIASELKAAFKLSETRRRRRSPAGSMDVPDSSNGHYRS